MCDLEVKIDVTSGRFTSEVDALRGLARQGLLRIDGNRFTVTEAGRPFVRIVAAVFDAYLAAGAKRHSAAV